MRVFSVIFILFFILKNGTIYGQSEKIPEYASLLSKYIQYCSETGHEKDAGLFLLQVCKEKGLYTEVLIDEDTAFNFVASVYPLSSNKPQIILLNHIDVVPSGDTTQWTQAPHLGIIKDSVVWGRGAIDNKGMAIAELFAISEFVESKQEKELPYNIGLLCVSGEETFGYTGSKQISEKYLSKLNPLVILGEGGSGAKGIINSDPERIVFGVSTSEKMAMNVKLRMKLETSGHGSVPPKEYAMKEMVIALKDLLSMEPCIKYHNISAEGLKQLGKYEKGIRGFVQRHFTFFFFRSIVKREIKKDPLLTSFFAHTIALTEIDFPETLLPNQITQEVTATLDCRLLPGTKPEKFLKSLQHWIDDDRIEIHMTYLSTAAQRTHKPAFLHILCNSVQSVYPGSICMEIIFPATSDNNFYRVKGVPVFGVFPACFEKGELESIHNFNERIHFERIDSSIKVYKKFIEGMINMPVKELSVSEKKK